MIWFKKSRILSIGLFLLVFYPFLTKFLYLFWPESSTFAEGILNR